MSIVNSATTVNGTTTLSLQTTGVTAATIDGSQNLSVVKDATVNGLTVGLGGGAVSSNTAIGYQSLLGANSGSGYNTALGFQTLKTNTSGYYNAGLGGNSLVFNTTGFQNTGAGVSTLTQNTTGNYNTAAGFEALTANTTGSYNSASGVFALRLNNGDNNSAFGYQALNSNTTASNNTAVGYQAGYSNTTSPYNTVIGYQAGYSNTTSTGEVCAVGYKALYNSTGYANVAMGSQAGVAVTTGQLNNFFGYNSGNAITTGNYNTIIGAYTGNNGGLDIRTASNNIVLSDGQGNPNLIVDGSGNYMFGQVVAANTNANSVSFRTGSGSTSGCVFVNHLNGTATGLGYASFHYNSNAIGSISQNGTTAVAYNTSSDYRLKEDVQPMQNALATVAQLNPVTYKWIADGSDGQGFIAHELQAVVPDCVTGEKDAVDEEGNPVYQGIDTSFLVATLTKAIQELSAKNDALEARLAALEAK